MINTYLKIVSMKTKKLKIKKKSFVNLKIDLLLKDITINLCKIYISFSLY